MTTGTVAPGRPTDDEVPLGRIPAVVRDVELTEPLPSLPALDDRGRRIDQVWLLVRLCTEPLGMVVVDIPDGGLGAAEAGAAVLDQLDGPIRSRVLAGGGDLGAALPAAGLALPRGSAYLARRAEVLSHAPSITAVVCTRERPGPLARCLEALLAQEYPRFRVLVVDNAPSSDATAEVVRRFAGRGPVDYVVARTPGLAHARNAALAHAGGEIVASIDDDELADPHWLAEIARAFSDHPAADAVTGMIVPVELETTAQMWFEQYGGHSKGRGFVRTVFSPATAQVQNPLFPLPPFGAGGNMAFRAGVMERFGGFDVALGSGTPAMGGEDTLAFMRVLRAKGTIVFQPTAVVRHLHRRDIEGLRTQLLGYGVGLTATYLGMLMKDPLAIFPLLGLAPRALREVLGSRGLRHATLADFPPELLAVNRRGLLRGPRAYVRSRLRERSRRAKS